MKIENIKTVYRIEMPEDKNGMWYNKNGVLKHNPNTFTSFKTSILH